MDFVSGVRASDYAIAALDACNTLSATNLKVSLSLNALFFFFFFSV